MTTFGGLANAAPTRVGGVTLYNPSLAQRGPVAVRPTSRTNASAAKRKTGGLPDDIDPRFVASSDVLSQRMQEHQKQQAADLPWWQDALGFTANVLSPLTVPGKLVTFGLEQATRHLPDPARRFLRDPVSYATPDSWEKNGFVDRLTEIGDQAVPLLNPFMGQDIEKIDADKRSFFNKIAPRSTYGSEAIYQDVPTQGLTGFRNLALDVGHDPLTFVAGGERVFAKGAEMAADVSKAARAAETASRGFDTAVEAYAKALQEGAHPMLQHGLSQVADETATNLAKASNEAARLQYVAENSRKVVHAPSTMGQRASFVAELAGKDPALVAKYQSELTKGINRGFGRMSAEAREAIQMAPRGLRIAGTDVMIPGTGRLVEGSGIVGSGIKRGMSKVGEYLPETFRNMRVPETVAEARRGLRSTSTSPEQYQLYSDYIRIVNDIRLGAGEMKLRGAQAVNREWKDNFAKLGASERDAARVAAEASPQANKVNEMMTKLAKIHEEITGRPFEDFSSINPNQYLPHIQTKEWAKWLKEHPDDPRAVAYKAATDFKTADMLHTSGFVDRSRKLRLGPGEVSKEIPLGDRTLRLNGNTIDNLNEGLAKTFPEFAGKFYETDLDAIFQTYSDALARDAGTRRAWKQLATSASPYGRTVEGELADSLDKMNEALRQQSDPARLRKMVEDRGGVFTPGERLEVPARPLAPGTKPDREALAFWKGYADDINTAMAKGDIDRIYKLTDNAGSHALPRTGVEVLGKNGQEAAGFTWAKIGDTITQVPDAALARGPAGDIPAEHLSIITPRVSDRATNELTQWAQSGVPTGFAGASNAEGNAIRKQIIAQLTDIQSNAYEGLRAEVNAGSARIKSLREAADEYLKKIKGLGKIDRNNAPQVTALKETVEKNIVDLEAEIRARNIVWKGKGTRAHNAIDKELNRQLRVLKDHVSKLEKKLNELPAEIRREIKWRREQLFKPVEDAKQQVRDHLAHFRVNNPLPYSSEDIQWALETEAKANAQAPLITDEAVEAATDALREEYRTAVGGLDDLRRQLSDGKLTDEARLAIEAQMNEQAGTVEDVLRRSAQVSNPDAARKGLGRSLADAQREADLVQGELDRARMPQRGPSAPRKVTPAPRVGPPPVYPPDYVRPRLSFREQLLVDEAWKAAGGEKLPPEWWRPGMDVAQERTISVAPEAAPEVAAPAAAAAADETPLDALVKELEARDAAQAAAGPPAIEPSKPFVEPEKFSKKYIDALSGDDLDALVLSDTMQRLQQERPGLARYADSAQSKSRRIRAEEAWKAAGNTGSPPSGWYAERLAEERAAKAAPKAAEAVVEAAPKAAPKAVKQTVKKVAAEAAEAPVEVVARDTTEIEARLAAAQGKVADIQRQIDELPAAARRGEAVKGRPPRGLRRAREINANMADYEKRMQAAIAEPQKRLNQAIEQMRKQPEALVYNRDKSMRYFHDEAGRWASEQSARPDVFGSRRVEAVGTPPQRGAYNVDVPGILSPDPMAPPEIFPRADVRVTPKGVRGREMRQGADRAWLMNRRSTSGVFPTGIGDMGDVSVGSHAVQVPPQRLESQALLDLERLAASPQQSAVGRYAANQRAAADIAEETLPTRIANEQKVAAEANEIGRLMEVLPKQADLAEAQKVVEPLRNLDAVTTQLAAEVDTRGQLRVLRDQYKSLPLGSKKLDLDATIRDLEQFNANNQLLDPVTRAKTDQQLKEFATESNRIAGNRDVVAGLGKMARDARSGKLKDEYLGGLAEGWKGLHDGPVQRGDFIMDERLRAMLLRAEKTIDDPKLFGRIFNEATNVFKTYATLSPSFHVRNAISGIFMNSADGVSLVNQLDGWKYIRQFRTAEDPEAWLAKQAADVREAFTIMGGSGGGGRFAEAGFAGLNDKAWLNKITRNRVTLFSQRAGERVEQSLRLGMALDSVRGGESMHQALERITKIHFDYSQLSKLDETMKRLIPFWTFMSRNLPLQLQMVYTRPQMYSAYEHFKRNMSAPDAAFTPGYWKVAGAFNTGAQIAGMPAYLQPDMGIDQIGQQLQQLKEIGKGNFGAALSELNPIALAPLEYVFKKDLYRDRTFGDADYSKASGPIGNLVKALGMIVPGATKEVNGERLVADNWTNFLTSVVPPISQASRLAPQATGDLSDLDRQIEAMARYLGIPVRTLSPKQQQTEARNRYFDAQDAATAQKKLARRAAA